MKRAALQQDQRKRQNKIKTQSFYDMRATVPLGDLWSFVQLFCNTRPHAVITVYLIETCWIHWAPCNWLQHFGQINVLAWLTRRRQDLGKSTEESEDEEEEHMDHTGSRFIMLERNRFRKASVVFLVFLNIFEHFGVKMRNLNRQVWTGVVTVLLMYIGTWFLFQLTFIDLHKPEPMQAGRWMFLGRLMGKSLYRWGSTGWTNIYIDCIFFTFGLQDTLGHDSHLVRPHATQPKIKYNYYTIILVIIL